MNRSLLIVEDDPDQLDLLTHRFIRAGYHVVSVPHPRQALEAASSRQFQVAILDLSLPEMDGIELMHRLQRFQEDVHVVILSGYEYPDSRAKQAGAFACLQKPCALASLESRVEDAWERATGERQVLEHAMVTERVPIGIYE